MCNTRNGRVACHVTFFYLREGLALVVGEDDVGEGVGRLHRVLHLMTFDDVLCVCWGRGVRVSGVVGIH